MAFGLLPFCYRHWPGHIDQRLFWFEYGLRAQCACHADSAVILVPASFRQVLHILQVSETLECIYILVSTCVPCCSWGAEYLDLAITIVCVCMPQCMSGA